MMRNLFLVIFVFYGVNVFADDINQTTHGPKSPTISGTQGNVIINYGESEKKGENWPKLADLLPEVYIATSSETIPLFPRELPKYRDTGKLNYWDEPYTLYGTIRIFTGDKWATIPDFPNNGNHCGEGLFMIRWRTSNPDVRVASNAAYGPEPSYNDPKRAKTGSFGYMVGTNCEQPLFRFAGTSKGNKSTLVDLHYELKFWQAAP